MSDESQDAWFYSHEGETIGPVPFVELVTKAKDGGLNPRLDLVWRPGMTDWIPAGEIEGLFEKRSLPPPDLSQVAHANPPLSPKQSAEWNKADQDTVYPGARRRSFLFMVLIFPILWGLGIEFGTPFLTQQFGEVMMTQIMVFLPLVPLVFALYFTVKRLINVGMSGWWFLGNFVPLLNFWVGYRTFVCPGGYAFTKKLDGPGIFLAILYWIFVVALILTIAAAVALLFGMGGNPELREQMQEALRTASEAFQTPPAK